MNPNSPTEPENDKTDTQGVKWRPWFSVWRYKAAKPDTNSDCQKPRKPNSVEIYTAVILTLALFAAAFAVIYSKSESDAAWKQVDIARDTARKELRAYLFIELAENISRESEQFERVRLRFNNGGQTPAYRLACDVRAFTEHPKVGESWTWTFPQRNNLMCRIGVLAKTASRFFKTDGPITTDGLIEGERHLFVVGVIYYDDIYAKPHWITFCMQWSRDNLTPEGATYCNVYNETDETLPDLPKRGPLVAFPISN